MLEPIFMKLGMYIMAPEAHINGVLHKSLPSACVYIVARQCLGKNITAATNKHAKIE
jgi:hypothetical protein